ncbi:hypothetical protein CEV31_2507 [Brucella thiophenivorans]|uniref:Uncharacterized protein n=1 Tax=Brucella thiophenivorans TaxID=571255 RepID=A0A256FWB6_9HYPH|nr:hypothetical protein CEV31_2507 [Brucella thiophenivorans]
MRDDDLFIMARNYRRPDANEVKMRRDKDARSTCFPFSNKTEL